MSNNQVLVDWLVRGSAEINRMKDEIQTVISIVKGAIGRYPVYEKYVGPNGLSFPCDDRCDGRHDRRWAVFFSGDKLVIEFWVGRSGPRFYSSADGKPSVHDVKDVHEHLGYLLEGLKERIPNFAFLISPYVFAAPKLPDVA